MLLKIDPSLSTPLRAQVIAQIKHLIDTGAMEYGSRLPASRKLAETLGVSRSTIYDAYGELQAMGYLLSRPGSYNIAQKRQPEVAYDPERRSIVSWAQASAQLADEVYQLFQGFTPEREARAGRQDKIVNLAGLEPDPRLFPMTEFRRSMNHVLASAGPSALAYGPYRGYRPLREYLAHRLRLHGIAVSTEEILVTNGAQQGIDLVLRLLTGTKSAVAIESPTYGLVLPLLRLHGTDIVPVPMKHDGMDLDVLERILQKKKISLVYTMPNFQNPTGITSNHRHRERLLRLCTHRRVPLLEDGFEEDLKYFGKVDLPIKSMDEKNIVIYLGTFSKALFPGIRLGWITAEKECVERLTAIKRFSDVSSGNLIQVVMHHFCKEGYYDLHLKRLHRMYRRRMEVAMQTMARQCPKGMTWTKPAGGYIFWVRMPRKLDRKGFNRAFARYGVAVAPGMNFSPYARTSECFRISIAALDEEEIKDALERLGRALRAIV